MFIAPDVGLNLNHLPWERNVMLVPSNSSGFIVFKRFANETRFQAFRSCRSYLRLFLGVVYKHFGS